MNCLEHFKLKHRTAWKITKALGIGLLTVLISLSLSASETTPFPESATVYLIKNDNTELAIGQIQFGAVRDGKAGFSIDMDNSVFTEHFLSMRPFRCLESDNEWFCFLPYPYALRNTISSDNLSDLEYQLLFIKKTPQEFGIDAWNGLYYQLSLNDDQTITGKLLEGDLNSLQSPPSEQYAKPIDLSEFLEASTTKRLYPSLIIR